jgi:enediyne biosynthesis protein E4
MTPAKYICAFALLLLVFNSCRNKVESSLFSPLSASSTGINFVNRLDPDPNFNLFSYMYYYNGSGVGAGDFNNDGLVDLFFAANRTGSALFLNKGSMRFENITATAGIPIDSMWSTGVSVVDLNNDGLLDLYVCRVGNYKLLKGQNSLYINKGVDVNGIPTFEDQAAAYGLDFSGYSTQAAFLDFDGDEDLDMFLLNHSVNHEGNYQPRRVFEGTVDSLAGHRLYRNDSEQKDGVFMPKFIDVSKGAGINMSKIGYGLGVAVSDINLDGWPDIYVGNDFHENDYLYINQRNGRFREEGAERLAHTSQFSMGVDMADITNDGYPEIISMDMLPYDPYMLRRSLSEDDYSIFRQKIEYGYTYQYARNNLQLNRRNGYFTEVGQYAGVFATDWSWASLWMDFNNDGWKDLFVSNGIPKRMNDIDYINYVSGEELQRKLQENSLQDKDLTLLSKFPEIKIPNQFFLNNGDVSFSNLTDSISNNPTSFSNGAVYADLDNDGDLDIVVSNINDPAVVYQNNTNGAGRSSSFAKLLLKGSARNTQAIGAKLMLYSGSQKHTYEVTPVHGFLSSMHGSVHIGLNGIRVDSAFLIWPDRSYQPLIIVAGETDTITYNRGLPTWNYHALMEPDAFVLVDDVTTPSGLLHRHTENRFDEFDREPLIPHMLTTEGPALAIADINHDGKEDVFVGASKTFHAGVYLQGTGGNFRKLPQPALMKDSMWEHVDAVWEDLNGDSHPDLVIATGGNEFYGQDVHLKPLLYLNDGKGNLQKKEDAFADLFATQSSVVVNDINGDGAADLFISGRSVPWQYGKPARSYLLQNDGKGKFSDVTSSWSAALVAPGMVTAASWTDINSDGRKDLLLSIQWGGIDAYINTGKKFERVGVTDKNGWWQFARSVDVDNDGDLDIIAGNFGLNSRLKATAELPVRLYINDFDGNGRVEQVMSYYVGGKEIPFASKILLEKSLPGLKKQFLFAEDFARADMKQLFGQKKLEQSVVLKADCFENMVFINEGNMKFKAQPMPAAAQWSTLRSAMVVDVDKNGLSDILLGGNFYANNVEIGRMDGDHGTVLINEGAGKFTARNVFGADLRGEVRKFAPLQIGDFKGIVVVKNNDSIKVIRLR